MFKHILVALDGSEYSRHALPAAIEVAKRFDSEVFVLHVHEEGRGRASSNPLETADDAARLVADAVQAVRGAGVPGRGHVSDLFGEHVGNGIVETASAQGSDLIVMGSRGLSGVESLVLGSVTQKVMHQAHTAVLVVRAPESAREAAELEVAATKSSTA